MPRTIQIRNVPEDVHRTLKVRAAQAGKSLSEFLLAEVTRVASRPTLDEIVVRIAQRQAVEVSLDSATAVREERDSRR